MHFFDTSLTTDISALFPRISERPPTRIDFPAPVSPVIIERPLLNSTETVSYTHLRAHET